MSRLLIDRRVALLRGVNVGGAKRVPMADLRNLVEALGYVEVSTLLNSGNVVFTVPKGTSGDAATRIERAIAARLGVSTRVTVLTGREVASAVRKNPFASVAHDPARLLVLSFPDPKAMARLKPLAKERWEPEALALGARSRLPLVRGRDRREPAVDRGEQEPRPRMHGAEPDDDDEAPRAARGRVGAREGTEGGGYLISPGAAGQATGSSSTGRSGGRRDPAPDPRLRRRPAD